MIKEILEILELADGETENIKIAQGKYKLPETFKEGLKQIKNEYRWQQRYK
jgi:hypothetical protein